MADTVVPDLNSDPVPVLSIQKGSSQDFLDSNNENQEAEGTGKKEQKRHSNKVSNCLCDDSSHSQFDDVKEEELQTGIDIKEVVSQSGPSNTAAKGNSGIGDCRQDGFHELLHLAQSAEVTMKNTDDHECEGCLLDELPKENGDMRSDEQDKLTVKENRARTVQKADVKSQKTEAPVSKKAGHLATKVQRTEVSSSSTIFSRSETKFGGKIDSDGISKRKKACSDEVHLHATENTALLQNNVYQRSASNGPRSNITVPQPFTLATDKRASVGGRIADGDAGYQAQKIHRLNGAFGSLNAKNLQGSKKMGKPYTVKLSHSESMKNPEELVKSSGKPMELKHDDDDSQSVSSVQSGLITSKAKLMGVNGFYSKCEERAEKRRQFYSKLEEKYKSREEEKNQLQAKTKEEMETEIRQLRKSLTFKATPMPSFYQEGIPPKVELKKIPPTRAKSPRLGRRNSCVGLDSDGLSGRSCRINREEHNGNGIEPKFSEDVGVKIAGMNNTVTDNNKPIRRSLPKMSSEKLLKDAQKNDLKTSSELDTGSINGPRESVKKRVGSAAGNSSVCVTLNGDGKAEGVSSVYESMIHLKREGDDSPQETQAGGVMSESICCPSEGQMMKDNIFTETDLQSTRSQSLSSVSCTLTKVKTGRSAEHVPNADNQDVNDKATKNTKRERLKASIPLFRNLKRENIGNGSLKQTIKGGHEMSPSVANVVVQ